MTKWILSISTPLLALTSNNWILIWVFLEFSSFSFILINKSNKNSESLMKYFIIQTMASITILLTMNSKMNSESIMNSSNFFMPMLLISALATKGSMAPLHMWAPEVSKMMDWKSLYVFLSIQKLTPIFLIISSSNLMIMTLIIFLSNTIGTIMQLSTAEFQIMMVYSSISHSSWMLMGGFLSSVLIIIYFFMYSIILYQILFNLMKLSLKSIINKDKNLNMVIAFLSFGGIPPLAGFMPKWLILTETAHQNYLLAMILILIMMSCLNIFIYVRIFSFSSSNTPKKLKFNVPSSQYILALNILPMLLVLMNIC